jgi:pimeloyl-ACP methyl ester carboxylesterase
MGSSLDGIEWSTLSKSPLVIAGKEASAGLFGPFAEQMMGRFRVVGIKADTYWNTITTVWWAGEPAVVVALGETGRLACRAASISPGSFRALVLADYVPPAGSTEHKGLAVPTLIFRGRQSKAQSHEQAVKLHEEMRGSHLIEPENCGAEPTKTGATVLAESITWFLEELGKPYMEFKTSQKPVDPKKR